MTIFAFGSAGDTRPLVALGQGLSARGFGVRMLTSARFAGLVQAAGIDLDALDVDPLEVVNSDEGRQWLSSRNPLSLIRGMREIIQPIADRLFEQALASASRSDALLSPVTMFAGADIAEYLDIPLGILHLQPGEPTRTAANPLIAAGRSLGPVLNRASYSVVEQVTWQIFRSMSNHRRTQRLGLAPVGLRGPFCRARRSDVPVFCGFSEAVVPRPADWPVNVHQTGFWFLPDQPGDGPDPSGAAAVHPIDPLLAAFMETGPAPVYVGFGSMVPQNPAQTWDAVHRALRVADARGVVLGPPDEPARLVSDTIIQVPFAPHSWLFPQCAVVVHHGGAGTTAAGLRAGVPSVICPFFSDQPFWAARVAALGAGPAALPIKDLTTAELASRITAARYDPSMRANAAAVASRMAGEDGVGAAVTLIERWLGTPARETLPAARTG